MNVINVHGEKVKT